MEVGRIIFYDTRDGEMLLNTGYIDNYMDSDVVEEQYKKLEDEYGNRNYVSHRFLRHGEYDREFAKYPSVRVTPEGEIFFSFKEVRYRIGIKHTMTDRWHPLFERTSGIYDGETFNVDILEYYYNDFINFNLKNTCRVVPVHWLHPTELRRANDSNEKALVRWDEDILPSVDKFANELLTHGCLLPLQIRKRDDGYNIILDGSHRVIAMKKLVEQGLWREDRRILTLQFNTTNPNYIDNPIINYKLDEPVTMHIPKLLMSKYSFITPQSVREYDENIMEVVIDKYLDMVTVFRMYVMELTSPIRRYTFLTGKVLKPAAIIEDEQQYNIWIKERD